MKLLTKNFVIPVSMPFCVNMYYSALLLTKKYNYTSSFNSYAHFIMLLWYKCNPLLDH